MSEGSGPCETLAAFDRRDALILDYRPNKELRSQAIAG
jgi:hypothetical protein